MTKQQLIEQEAERRFNESKFISEPGTQAAYLAGFIQGANFALELVNEWVSVEERLPEQYAQRVIIVDCFDSQHFCKFNTVEKVFVRELDLQHINIEHVKCWLPAPPLPSPPTK